MKRHIRDVAVIALGVAIGIDLQKYLVIKAGELLQWVRDHKVEVTPKEDQQ